MRRRRSGVCTCCIPVICAMLLGRCRGFLLQAAERRYRRQNLDSFRFDELRRRPFSRLQSVAIDTASPARPSAKGKSLDVNLLSEDPELVLAHLKARRSSGEQLSSLVQIKELNIHRKKMVKKQQAALAERKTLSAQIGNLMKHKQNEEAEKLKAAVEVFNREAAEAEQVLPQIEQDIDSLISQLPNLLDDLVPDGEDETANEVISEWGAHLKKVGEGYEWHDSIAAKLGGYDPDCAVRAVVEAKISGARFSVLMGPLARLERAIAQFFLDLHTTRNGYREISVPFIVSRATLTGTGQLPKFEEDLFAVNHKIGGQDAYLIPTAEVPLTSLHREEILDAAQLPLNYVAHTPCFRAEAGSHGRDTRGLLRQHQFGKVELVKVTTAETSAEEHETLTRHAEGCLQLLKLPYRKLRLCSGDIGFAAQHCYDLEVWLPAQQAYKEIASCSNCGDFQAKRMGLKHRSASQKATKKGKERPVFCHTINGSGLAVGRTLVAILENYQEANGTVIVPEVLRAYMGGMERLEVTR